jgi:predicted adenylyl cyclase CyaB
MKEVELKFRIKDEKEIKKKLHKMGFKRKRRETHIDIPLSQVYNQLIKSWVRIRYFPSSKKLKITVKEKPELINRLDIIRDEVEFSVNENMETIKKFFKLLGYIPMGVVEKSRELFTKDNVYVVIDKVKGLGIFLEIEVKDKDEKNAMKKLIKYKKLFNLKDSDIVNQGYFDLQNKNACKLFYCIMRNINKKKFVVKVPKNIKVKKISKNILEIREMGSYFIGFLNPLKITRDKNKLNIEVLEE